MLGGKIMNDITYSNYIRNLTTPVNSIHTNTQSLNQVQQSVTGESFADILNRQINPRTSIEFSKHAMNRVMERNIDLSADKLERLNAGVKLAEEKGLNDTLILVDSLAFVVNVKNNKVITTVGQDGLRGNVFTNIDGTVIV